MNFKPGHEDLPPVKSAGQVEVHVFEYLAMDDNGRELRGQLRATDDIEAVAKLRRQHLFPIEVWRSRRDGADTATAKRERKELKAKIEQARAERPRLEKAVSTTPSRGSSLLQRLGMAPVLKPKLLALFTRQLSTMLDAGLPLLMSLRTLHEQYRKGLRYRTMHRLAGDLARKIEAGMSLSEALAYHPGSFNRLYIGLVRAGEASGALNEVLNRLAEYIEKTERLKKKIKAGMTYPVVVLVIALTITFGLMVGVVPKFAEMFDQILEGTPLPTITMVVIGISRMLLDHLWVMVGVAVGMVMALRIFVSTRVGKRIFDWCIITLPPFGVLVNKIAIARFCSTLGTLLDSGVPILDALRIVQEASTNEVVVRTLERLYAAVAGGEKLATPLEHARIFPGMVVRMIEVGEQTGSLPTMLKRIGKTFEEEVEMALEALVSLIEPLMICFLAIVVGSIVMALFMPLIKIIEVLGA